MKRLICSAAVASALLAAGAIPSSAATIGLFGLSTESDTVYDDTYSFHVSAAENVMIAGGEDNITGFNISAPFTVTYTGDSFSGMGVLGIGNYSVVVSGTGNPGTLGYSFYGGAIKGTNITPTPIPGTLALFASGLGLLGFWSWNKRRKARSGSASLEALPC
jgi:hypothetical protein